MGYLDADVKAYVEEMVAHANAEVGALRAVTSDHSWADSGTAGVAVLTTETVLATATVTPKLTGKFRVIATFIVNNTGTVAHSLTPRIAHGPATNLTDDYTGVPALLVLSGTSSNAAASLVFEYTAGAAFTAGTAVNINLVGLADVVTALTISAHGAQISVQEIL